MKEDEAKKSWEEDDEIDMNIEDLTEIQGGIEDNEIITPRSCGLGCFIRVGTAYE